MKSLAGSKQKRSNPFYVLLVLAGVAFSITACAYGVMIFQEVYRSRSSPEVPVVEEGFTELMDRHGPKLLVVEIVVLALATFAAIGVDQYGMQAEFRSQRRQTGQPTNTDAASRVNTAENET